jgi:hypothetical protein
MENKKTYIIGFSGKIGSGKDYVAKNIFLPMLINLKINPLILSFADPLKQECALRYESTYEELYINKNNITRKRLQDVGDDFRNKYGATVYVNAMKMNIKLHTERSNVKCIIIPDVRFPEEMKFIQNNGGKVFRIVAKNRSIDKLKKECNEDKEEMNLRSNHISETALDDKCFDGYVKNDNDDNIFNDINNIFNNFYF